MKRLSKLGLLVLMIIPMVFFNACKSKVADINVTNGKTVFLYGEDFSLGDNIVVETTMKNKKKATVDLSDLVTNGTRFENEMVIIDFSAYNKNQTGEYEIVVSYRKDGSISESYKVTVVANQFTSDNYTVEGYDGVYDGNLHTIKITNNVGATVKYGITSGSYTLDTPNSYRNAGEYTIFYKIEKPGYEPPVEGSATVKIRKAELNVTPNNVVIAYNERFKNKGCTFDGFVNGETAEDYKYKGTPSWSTDYIVGSDVGEYTITVDGYSIPNYDIIYNTGKLTVTKAVNKLTAQLSDITYGSSFNIESAVTNPAGGNYNIQYTVKDAGDWQNGLPVNYGTYTIQFSTEASKNYEAATFTIDVSILKKTLRIIPNDVIITYGEEFVDNGSTYNAFIVGEDESVLAGIPVYTTDYKPGDAIGTYIITLSGYEATNYAIEYGTGTLTVDKSENVFSVTINDVVYGTAITPVVVENLAGTEVVYSYKEIGSGSGYITGLPQGAGEYEIKATSLESDGFRQSSKVLRVTIRKKTLDITPITVNINYNEPYVMVDGESGFEYDGFEYEDTSRIFRGMNPTINYISYAKGYDAGEYTVNYTGYTADNYNVVFHTGIINVLKAKRTFDVQMLNTSYGDALVPSNIENIEGPKPTFTYAYAVSGSEEFTDSKNLPTQVGTYDIKIRLVETTNYAADEKLITGVTIEPRKINATPKTTVIRYNDAVETIEYEGIDYSNELGASVFAYGENESVLGGTVVYATNYEQGSDAGEYEITFSGIESANYQIIYKKGRLVVNRAVNNLVIGVPEFNYGDKIVFNVISNPSGEELRYQYRAEGTTDWLDSSALSAGRYAVRVSCIESKNYEKVENLVLDTQLVINKKNLTICAKEMEIHYNELPAYELEIKDFAYNETIKVLNGNQEVQHADYLTLFHSAYTKGSDVGEYEVTIRNNFFTSTNYNLIYTESTLTVVKADNELVATINPKDYGTSIEPEGGFISNPSNGALTYSYRVNENDEWVNGLPVNVGTYTIKIESEATKNYHAGVTVVENVQINKKELTITPNGVKIHYNEEFVNNGADIQGFVYDETPEVLGGELIFSTSYQVGSDVDHYDIILSGLESANYSFKYINDNKALQVDKAINTLSVTVTGVTYGSPINIAIEDKNSDADVVVKYCEETSTEYTTEIPVNAGRYNVVVTQSATKNYEGYTGNFQNIDISQLVAEIQWGETVFVYDKQQHLPTATITNVLAGDTVELYMSLPETDANEAGYTAYIYSLSNTNYRLPQVNNINFYINRAPIDDPAEILSQTYNGTLLKPAVTEDNEGRYSIYYGSATGYIEAGSYPVVFTMLNPNYKWKEADSNQVTRNFVINKATDNAITGTTVMSFDYGTADNEITIEALAKYGTVIIDYREYGEELYNQSRPVDAGKYVVRFRVLDNESFNECSTEIEFTIYKINPVFDNPDMLVTCFGEKVGELILPSYENGKFEWDDEDHEIDDDDTDNVEVEFPITFKPYDNKNYNDIELTVTVHIVDNRTIDINVADVVISDLEEDYSGEYIEPELVLNNTATDAIVFYNIVGEVDEETGERIYKDGLPSFVSCGTYSFYLKLTKNDTVSYTYKGVEYRYQRHYNDFIYPTTLSITINDWIKFVSWTDMFKLAILRGTDIDLTGHIIDVNYASGIIEKLDGGMFDVTGYNNQSAGVQAVNFEYDGRVYEEVMNVLVYEPVIENFTINYTNASNIESSITVNKDSAKVFSTTITDMRVLNFNTDTEHFTINGSNPLNGVFNIDGLTVINLKAGTHEHTVYFNLDFDGEYRDVYTLNLVTSITKIIIDIDNYTASYDSVTDEYTIDAMSPTFDKLEPVYGEIQGVYLDWNAYEHREETLDGEGEYLNLIYKHNNMLSFVKFEDYPTTVVEVISNYVQFVFKLNVIKQDLPVQLVTVAGIDYVITEVESTVEASAQMGTKVVVDFHSFSGLYGNIFLSENTWLDDAHTTVTLSYEVLQDGVSYVFGIYTAMENGNKVQTITIHLTHANNVESFDITTNIRSVNLDQNRYLSLASNERIEDVDITMEAGYSYRLYVNGEETDSIDTMSLRSGSGQNGLALVTLDAYDRVIAYTYYTIEYNMYCGDMLYGLTESFDEKSLAPNTIKYLSEEYKTIYLSFAETDDGHTYTERLVVNGAEIPYDDVYNTYGAISLHNGMNIIQMHLTIDGQFTVLYEYFVYIGEIIEVGGSEYASDFEAYNIYYKGTQVIHNIAGVGINYFVDSMNINLSDYVIKTDDGTVLTNVTVTTDGRYIYIARTITVQEDGQNKNKVLLIPIKLNLNNVVMDDNTDIELYYYADTSGKYTYIAFNDEYKANVGMFSGDSLVVIFKNKKATFTATGGSYMDGSNYIQVNGSKGSSKTVTITVRSSDGTATRTYTVNVAISKREAFAISHVQPDTSVSKSVLTYEGFIYTGDILVTAESEYYMQGMIIEKAYNYNYYDEFGNAYTTDDKYIKVSAFESVYDDFGIYRTMDKSTVNPLSLISCLSDEITTLTNVLLPVQNDGTYDYYTFFAYFNSSILEMKVYLVDAGTEPEKVTFTINYNYVEEGTPKSDSATYEVTIFDGIIYGQAGMEALTLTTDEARVSSGSFVGYPGTYYVASGYVVYSSQTLDPSTLVGEIYMNESGKYVLDEGGTLPEGTEFIFNTIQETVNFLAVSDAILSDVISTTTITMSVTSSATISIDNVSIDAVGHVYSIPVADISSFNTTPILYLDGQLYAITLRMTIGTETYLIAMVPFRVI